MKLRGYRIELAEIEHALTATPAVQEAAVALRSASDREPQLAAYVVPGAGGETWSEDTLRRELRQRLPQYMIPSSITLLAALPRTPSGKLDRSSLPAPGRSPAGRRPYVAPTTALELFLAEACQKVLDVERVGMRDSFYELGGTSIQGATLLALLQDELEQRVQTSALFDLTEIGELAAYLAEHYSDAVARRFGSSSAQHVTAPQSADAQSAGAGPTHELVVPLQPRGSRTALFMVHPPGGIVLCYQPLARHLGTDQPLYGIRARGLHGEEQLPATLPEMAAEYVAALRTIQPEGPYQLGGWSLGGVVAYEMAQQLVAAGQEVQALVLLDTTIPEGEANQQFLAEAHSTGLEYGLDVTLEQLGQLGPDQQLPYLYEHARKLGVIDQEAPESLVQQVLEDLKQLFHAHLEQSSRYAIRLPGPRDPAAAQRRTCAYHYYARPWLAPTGRSPGDRLRTGPAPQHGQGTTRRAVGCHAPATTREFPTQHVKRKATVLTVGHSPAPEPPFPIPCQINPPPGRVRNSRSEFLGRAGRSASGVPTKRSQRKRCSNETVIWLALRPTCARSR